MTGLQELMTRLRARVATDDRHRKERVLAGARACLAACALLALYIDPTQPSRYVALAYGLLVGYLAASLVVLALLQVRRDVGPIAQSLIHAIDVGWAAALTLFTEGPSSPFFVFFIFVLVAASFRWGFRQTLMTAATVTVLLFVEAVLVSPGPGLMGRLVAGRFEVHRLVMREAYVGVLGLLLAYLANNEQRRGAEASAIARIVGKVQAETGFKGTLQAVADEVFALVGGRGILLAIEEVASGRAFLWEVRRLAGGTSAADETTLRVTELEPPLRESYLLPVAFDAFLAVRSSRVSGGPSFQVDGLDREGRRESRSSMAATALASHVLLLHPFRALAGVSVRHGNDWNGRVLVLDPDAPSLEGLRLLQALVRQIAPSVLSVQLVRRLRSRAGAMERARVARELHDGVTQALVGLEMRVDALRRRAQAGSLPLEAELSDIQQHLHDEVLNLRELMQQMKPIDLRPNQLVDFLAEQTERFRRETGISASFISDLHEVALTPRVCRELARIVQEALVNVRKHSGARHAVVRLSARNGDWVLEVDDDGRGCDFEGRLSHDELEEGPHGPLVIKERVRAIGGRLTVESHRGRGTSLTIALPRSRRYAAAH